MCNENTTIVRNKNEILKINGVGDKVKMSIVAGKVVLILKSVSVFLSNQRSHLRVNCDLVIPETEVF